MHFQGHFAAVAIAFTPAIAHWRSIPSPKTIPLRLLLAFARVLKICEVWLVEDEQRSYEEESKGGQEAQLIEQEARFPELIQVVGTTFRGGGKETTNYMNLNFKNETMATTVTISVAYDSENREKKIRTFMKEKVTKNFLNFGQANATAIKQNEKVLMISGLNGTWELKEFADFQLKAVRGMANTIGNKSIEFTIFVGEKQISAV